MRNEKILGCRSVASRRFWGGQVIAYGLHIGTRVEMSTLGETNNAQFFLKPESCAFYRDSNSAISEPPRMLKIISFGWWSNQHKPTSALVIIAVSGGLTSWVVEAARCSIALTRLMCASSACASMRYLRSPASVGLSVRPHAVPDLHLTRTISALARLSAAVSTTSQLP